MKKLFAVLLALLLLVPAALAETPVVRADDGALYLVTDRLLKLSSDNHLTSPASGDIHIVGYAEGTLYYVLRMDEDEFGETQSETLLALKDDGSAYVLGEKRPYYAERSYDEESGVLQLCNTYNGYRDATLYDGSIYFIGDEEVAGTYEAIWGYEDEKESYISQYTQCAAVYRMDPKDGSLTKIVGGLGNGAARLSVGEDSMAVCSCYVNPVYAYDFSDFFIYDLDGNLLKQYENNGQEEGIHDWYYMEDVAFTAIVVELHWNGERLLVSLGDSEGDFFSSRLVDIEQPDEVLTLEACYTPSVQTEDGTVFCLSDGSTNVFARDLYHMTLRRLDAEGTTLLNHLPRTYCDDYMETRLGVCENMVYLSFGSDILRISEDGGTTELLGEDGFTANALFSMQYYTPATESEE